MTVDRLRCCLVGPTRTRAGLGPFYARHIEAAGGRLLAVAGRDLARTQAAALALASSLGHDLNAYDDVAAMLERERPQALVIASPEPAHQEALTAALAARVPVLCEKPLLPPELLASVADLVARFAAAEVPLFEACQWPQLLGDLEALCPSARLRPATSLALGLGPVGVGRAMVVDSLSHFLSLLQAVAPVDATTRLVRATWSGRGPASERIVLAASFAGPFPPLAGRLELQHCPQQPRPAFLAVNDARAEREIDPKGYRISLRAGERSRQVRDPLAALVYGFTTCVREQAHDRVRAERAAIRERARLFGAILASYDQD